MIPLNQTVLCKYHYDPLDRLASSVPTGQADIQRFYQKNRLATEIQGALRRMVFQHEDLLLAQQRRVDGVLETTLLATDQQRSVLQLVDKAGTEPIAYSPYGHHPAESGLTSLLGFNGERRDPVTGHYLLGNGYRAYNPVLMRFNSPDSLSPFDEGGLNAYGYVGGDPVGFGDESGHMRLKSLPRRVNPNRKTLKAPNLQSSRGLPERSHRGKNLVGSGVSNAGGQAVMPSIPGAVASTSTASSSRPSALSASGVSSNVSSIAPRRMTPKSMLKKVKEFEIPISTAVPDNFHDAFLLSNQHDQRNLVIKEMMPMYTANPEKRNVSKASKLYAEISRRDINNTYVYKQNMFMKYARDIPPGVR
ncbi:RHS repeat-associated core domain-containing protein, partial [Pseudomonas syringae]|uniref:RHS repeat-associated core domain-containing protein n=1 Tax=Pseudomonas syringae TaxID=317 RepID=UPI0021807407